MRAELRRQGIEEIDKEFLEAFEMDFEEKCNVTDDVPEFSESVPNFTDEPFYKVKWKLIAQLVTRNNFQMIVQ